MCRLQLAADDLLDCGLEGGGSPLHCSFVRCSMAGEMGCWQCLRAGSGCLQLQQCAPKHTPAHPQQPASIAETVSVGRKASRPRQHL